jgi:AcrR family transcriptional regulator
VGRRADTNLTMSSTDTEIMEATYRVLVSEGYAGLSMRRIAEEFEGSQSAIYYYYDDKEDLLAGFLKYLTDAFAAELEQLDEPDPSDRLRAVVDFVLPASEDTERLLFQQTLMEIRAQIPHRPRYRDRFEAVDAKVQSELEATIERGLADGTFVGVTPAEGADLIQLLLYGIVDRHVPTQDWEGIERGRACIDAQIERWES